ncbi:hypothetical protein O181_007793 [Austropuccinia psidii MF-1]|uniref:Reverse transcriptase Ty1/copia-type domain-containing protein n=1 Tax=Austropuccinia psidii MF-1 TaxID=1389203 RepID=A0A9Q3BMY0_9BASI|nr:hypothetical protein [Austropuccinia psidii MF-1]
MHKSRKAMIWLHVDNSIIAAEDKALLLQLRDKLSKSFKLKWEDAVTSIIQFLGSAWDGMPSTKCNLVTLSDTNKVVHARDYIGVVGALSYIATGYVHHTKHLSLCLEPQHKDLQLDVCSDASWGGEFSQSTHSSLTQVNGCSVLWCAKRLVKLASSSCYAEFMTLGMAARHGKWMKSLIDDMLGTPTLQQHFCHKDCDRLLFQQAEKTL